MSLMVMWLNGLLKKRFALLLGPMFGIAATVALMGTLGAFITSSAATMTRHAQASVPIDWQVQMNPGVQESQVISVIDGTIRHTAMQKVMFAQTEGFVATTGTTTQTTGPGQVLGLSSQYLHDFPGQVRVLAGSLNGVCVDQQAAANLHVQVGDTVTIKRVGLPPVNVRVTGIVAVMHPDTVFQAVGMAASAAPQAPPDNVLLMPSNVWHQTFDKQATNRPGSVKMQEQIQLDTSNLSGNPTIAYTQVTQLSHHVEAQLAGSVAIADNLANQLGAVRADALYARVLFLFLGLPGAIIAALLTLSVASAGSSRRRKEQALLRTRGASPAYTLRLQGLEALVVGVFGTTLGLLAAQVTSKSLGFPGVFATSSTCVWSVLAGTMGLLLALGAILYPAWKHLRLQTVLATRSVIGRHHTPLWQRLYVDIVLLALAIFALWQSTRTGYQLVLVPDGVAKTSVHYEVFIGPLFMWIGGVLLCVRIWHQLFQHGKGFLVLLFRPIAHRLSGVVVSSMISQRKLIVRGIVFIALTFSFATSTAIFNSTYNAQARVDAQLTNGADVTVTGQTSHPAATKLAEVASIPGVQAVDSMQHRFAYVGNDLQDIYGIHPRTIGKVTQLSNAFFANGDAQGTLQSLALHPDGVLVSAETARDYQLNIGDTIRLRLQNQVDHKYHVVPFQFLGIVRKFPTAPRDSFLVANASYISKMTQSPATEIVLIRTNNHPDIVAKRVQQVVSSIPGATVSDIVSTQKKVNANLTAVDLHGLTKIELGFAFLLTFAAAGLIFALSLAERRRMFAVLTALGAKTRQLGNFVWGEALLIFTGGSVIGVSLGFGISETLVQVLKGVFDPPPTHLVVPWIYIGAVVLSNFVCSVFVVIGAVRSFRRARVDVLRSL